MNLDFSVGEVALAGMVGVFTLVMWLLNRGKNAYDFTDIFLGPDGKASLDKHILAGMAGLAGWCVVKQAIAGQSVETLLLGVLTVFVVQRGVRDGIEAFRPKGETRGTAESDIK